MPNILFIYVLGIQPFFTYVNRAVVLVDLDAQVVSNCGEVVWLRHMSQSVVLATNRGLANIGKNIIRLCCQGACWLEIKWNY